MTCFYFRALAIILELDTLADTAVVSTSKSNDASSAAASWKGASCVRHRQHALLARLWNSSVPQLVATGSALRMALILCSTYTLDEWTTNEPQSVRLFRTTIEVTSGWVCLVHSQLAFTNPWLLATVIDTRMPTQEPEQWADNCFEKVDEKRDAWLTIPFVSRRSTCSLSTDRAESVVVLGMVNSSLRGSCGVHPLAQPVALAQARPLSPLRHDIPQCRDPSGRPEAGEGIEVVRACASDQDGKAAGTAATVSQAIRSTCHAI